MNDLQKFASDIIKALKPLSDAIDQISAIAQQPLIDTTGMCKTVTIQGAASSAALIDPVQWCKPVSMIDKDVLSKEFEELVASHEVHSATPDLATRILVLIEEDRRYCDHATESMWVGEMRSTLDEIEALCKGVQTDGIS